MFWLSHYLLCLMPQYNEIPYSVEFAKLFLNIQAHKTFRFQLDFLNLHNLSDFLVTACCRKENFLNYENYHTSLATMTPMF